MKKYSFRHKDAKKSDWVNVMAESKAKAFAKVKKERAPYRTCSIGEFDCKIWPSDTPSSTWRK